MRVEVAGREGVGVQREREESAQGGEFGVDGWWMCQEGVDGRCRCRHWVRRVDGGGRKGQEEGGGGDNIGIGFEKWGGSSVGVRPCQGVE